MIYRVDEETPSGLASVWVGTKYEAERVASHHRRIHKREGRRDVDSWGSFCTIEIHAFDLPEGKKAIVDFLNTHAITDMELGIPGDSQ